MNKAIGSIAILLTLICVVGILICPIFYTADNQDFFDTECDIPDTAYDISTAQYTIIDRTTNIMGRPTLVVSDGTRTRRVFVSQDVLLKTSENQMVTEYSFKIPVTANYGQKLVSNLTTGLPFFITTAAFAVFAWIWAIYDMVEEERRFRRRFISY